MIKAIFFDLDGVLVDTKPLHFEALNKALSRISSNFIISYEDHLKIYDGLTTHSKLQILTETKGLASEIHDTIWQQKQKETEKLLSKKIKKSKELGVLFQRLKGRGLKLAVVSNSIKKTTSEVLIRLGIYNYLDLIISNEDVKNSKPHPEPYLKALVELGLKPQEVLVLEDAPHGIKAAQEAGVEILIISNLKEVNYSNIEHKIQQMKNNSCHIWQSDNLNVLIPMAGAGTRFEKAGYTFPKPLIDVLGKPMIQIVLECIKIKANYIFVAQKSHCQKYNLESMLKVLVPNCKVIPIEGLTEGAACTTLLAKFEINNNKELVIVNSDQYFEYNVLDFFYKVHNKAADGAILTFDSVSPKWSFAKVDEHGYVTEVAEKRPISRKATVGYYWFKKGADYVKFVEQMITKNIRVNNEFYVCPVFNEFIQSGAKILDYQVNKMKGLGTPEDLNDFKRELQQ